jgi:hypothetical protein
MVGAAWSLDGKAVTAGIPGHAHLGACPTHAQIPPSALACDRGAIAAFIHSPVSPSSPPLPQGLYSRCTSPTGARRWLSRPRLPRVQPNGPPFRQKAGLSASLSDRYRPMTAHADATGGDRLPADRGSSGIIPRLSHRDGAAGKLSIGTRGRPGLLLSRQP